MRALITGITGFAGQHLTQHLLRLGDQVIGSTYRDQWNADVASEVGQQVELFEWNLAEPLTEAAWDMIERFAPDSVYHLAAISVPAQCGTAEPSPLSLAVNVEGTRAVIELARALPHPPRVLVVSSSHVYAPVSAEHPVVAEDAPLGPKGAYGQTKLRAEQVCQAAIEQGSDVIVVRAFQHSGPRQLPMFMLPEWAEQFAVPDGQPVQVVTLESHLDLSDVRDVVRAYRLLMHSDTRHRIYNVGSGRSIRSGDVFQLLERAAGQPREAVQRSPGRRQHPVADISRLVSDTQWKPHFSLEQTVADTLADFQQRTGRGQT